MPVLDFCEIPEANKNMETQDTFEFFARDYLDFLDYVIIEGPDRGQDGGRDIIVEEIRKGVGGETRIRWLVSCKHYAHTGKSVGITDEQDISGRIDVKKCTGFIGFYSTIPSSSLTRNLEALKQRFEYQIFDREKIERYLLKSSEGLKLAKRYFPKSTTQHQKNHSQPETFFWKFPELYCKNCGANLLNPKKAGIIVIWERDISDKFDTASEVVEVYCCCKGRCDTVLRDKFHSHQYQDAIDGWEDIPDICIPTIYLKWLNALFDNFYGGRKYSKEAFNNMKNVMLSIFPYISRQLTDKEKDTIINLTGIPAFLGGLGKN